MVVAAGVSSTLVRVLVLVLTALLAVALVRAAARALPGERRPRRRRVPPPAEPEILTRLRRQLEMAQGSSLDAHYRLRSELREIASALLRRHRRVELDESPDEAHALLGDVAWELLRPDRVPPEDRHARGLTADDLQRVVEALEAQR
jgi:hypothetical protein